MKVLTITEWVIISWQCIYLIYTNNVIHMFIYSNQLISVLNCDIIKLHGTPIKAH